MMEPKTISKEKMYRLLCLEKAYSQAFKGIVEFQSASNPSDKNLYEEKLSIINRLWQVRSYILSH